MEYHKRVTVTVLLLISSLYAGAQYATTNDSTLHLSLTEVWQKAVNANRSIALSKKEVAIHAETQKDAVLQRLPEVNITGSIEKLTNMPVYQDGILHAHQQHDIIHTLYRTGADLYFNLYNGNKLNLRIEEEKLLYKTALIKEEETITDVRFRAAAAYLSLQQALLFKALLVNDIASHDEQLTEIRENFKNGVVLKSDVLRAELDLSGKKMTLVQAENDILIANQQLNILIGEKDEQVIQPEAVPDSPFIITGNYEQYLAIAMQHAFDLQLSEQETQLADIHLQQSRSLMRPSAGLYGSFYYSNPQVLLYPYNPFWSSLGIAGIKVKLPVSSLYHNTRKIKAARLEIEREEIRHKDTEDKIRQQVKEAWLHYREALLRIDVARKNVDQAIENERIIRNTYFNHTALITDLLNAGLLVLQSRFELTTAKITAQLKYHQLQHITGTL
ncbi:MAG: TolC family protein [Chitinophagaceae bacterium]